MRARFLALTAGAVLTGLATRAINSPMELARHGSTFRALFERARVLAVAAAVVGCTGKGEAPAPDQPVRDPGEAAIRVDTSQARVGRLEREVTATGITSPWQETNLRAEAGGRVLSVSVDNGDVVEVGDALLKIDGSRQRLAVSGASAQVDALERDVELARSDAERKRALAQKGSLPAAQLEAADNRLERAEAALAGAKANLGSARRSTRDTRITAPIAGIVARRVVDQGDVIGPGTPLLDVVDLSKVRVQVGLAGSEIGRLDQEAEAQARIEDLGGEAVAARFAALAPSADPMTGLFTVEYHVDNADARIRGGMVATVELPLRKAREQVLVPRSSLTRRGGQLAVFVFEGGNESRPGGEAELARGVARLVPVRVGAYGDAVVEILGGLEGGERVVTSALHALADGVIVESGDPKAAAPMPLANAPGQTPDPAPAP